MLLMFRRPPALRQQIDCAQLRSITRADAGDKRRGDGADGRQGAAGRGRRLYVRYASRNTWRLCRLPRSPIALLPLRAGAPPLKSGIGLYPLPGTRALVLSD